MREGAYAGISALRPRRNYTAESVHSSFEASTPTTLRFWGATRVRPRRLRHTYGTELASAGIDLMVLRDLTGHVSPETTAGYVHLSIEHLAAEYGAARASLAGARQ